VVLTDLSIFLDSWLSISVVSSSRICSFVFFSCWFFLFADRSDLCTVRFCLALSISVARVWPSAFSLQSSLSPRGAGIRHRVSVSISMALFCFCHHGSSAERVRDSTPASVVSGCDFLFARTSFMSCWSFHSQAAFSV
jgi:hypothetical protein